MYRCITKYGNFVKPNFQFKKDFLSASAKIINRRFSFQKMTPLQNTFVNCFFDKETNTAQYIFGDHGEKKCAILDSVLDFNVPSGRIQTTNADKIIQFVSDNNLSVEWILETHVHADHLTASNYLKSKIGGKIAIGKGVKKVQQHFKPIFNIKDLKTDGSQFDHLLRNGEW